MPQYPYKSHHFTLLLVFLWVVVLPLAGSAQFQPANPDLPPLEDPSIDAGDFDGDGNPDVVVTGRVNVGQNLARIYRNGGNGSFSELPVELTGVSGGDASWGDYDRDGDLDLAVTGWDARDNPTATIYENQGGTFSETGSDLQGVVAGSSDWGDFDGDGDLDLAVVGTAGNITPTANLYENKNGTFEPVEARLRGVQDGSVQWVDVNQDGRPDLVITGKDVENFPFAVVYLNKGDGKFQQMETGMMGVFGETSIDTADYNGDGYPDLVVTGWNANLQPSTLVYKNYQGDSLAAIEQRFMGIVDGQAQWVDYNRDGRTDLFVAGINANNQVVDRLYRNEGGGKFQNVDTNIEGLWRCNIAWRDFTGSGYPDLLMMGVDRNNEPAILYYKNNGKPASDAEGGGIFQ